LPVRTCTGCRKTTEKREMLRIVKTREGVSVDREQRLSGRGAYVHRDAGCVRMAAERGSLGKTLRCAIPAAIVAEVVALLGSQGTR
jgi:predicted RNA-binding protein YlxR (DUF448 family)